MGSLFQMQWWGLVIDRLIRDKSHIPKSGSKDDLMLVCFPHFFQPWIKYRNSFIGNWFWIKSKWFKLATLKQNSKTTIQVKKELSRFCPESVFCRANSSRWNSYIGFKTRPHSNTCEISWYFEWINYLWVNERWDTLIEICERANLATAVKF